MQAHSHSTHPAIIKRLKRAQGHLGSVIEMIEQQRPCLELAQQLHAVEKALYQAKRTLVQDHIDHCLESALGDFPDEQHARMEEFKQITRYL